MGNPVVHFELIGPDPEVLRAFYAALFDWSAPAGAPVAPAISDEASYSFIPPSEDAGAAARGIGGGAGFAAHAICYVGVEDVAATLAEVERLGGTVVLGPQCNEGGDVVVGHFRDPAGNLVGVAGPARPLSSLRSSGTADPELRKEEKSSPRPPSSVRGMVRLRVHNLAVSLDGFGTGEGQSLDTPFGHAGHRLMDWFLPTRTFVAGTGHGSEAVGSGTTGVDDAFAAQTNRRIGAEIMGRNKFEPLTGLSDPDAWQGWWGDQPPFHTPVVVLTHRPRPDLVLGETRFLFRDATPREALAEATALAGGLDVRLGGGPTTVREFLDADLVDHLHVVVSPIVLGRGVRLWDGQEGLEDRFDVETTASPTGVVHHVFTRRR